jgi:hypothetical protein
LGGSRSLSIVSFQSRSNEANRVAKTSLEPTYHTSIQQRLSSLYLGTGSHKRYLLIVALFYASGISCVQDRREILDWYHLNENLQKVGSSIKRLKQAETYLWQGNVPSAIALFTKLKKKPAINFCKYLEKHQERIINYEVFQRDGICSIGSGAVESGIKQIARRIKISGASWKSEHVGQVLAHRCAYLNGLIGKSRKAA